MADLPWQVEQNHSGSQEDGERTQLVFVDVLVKAGRRTTNELWCGMLPNEACKGEMEKKVIKVEDVWRGLMKG